ncbi:MAG TPA: CHAT domain-containing protein [Steroidobacteraceae bacterium]|nr:CHAT domain-containing protein [Steroidobacteraceae bacterium]
MVFGRSFIWLLAGALVGCGRHGGNYDPDLVLESAVPTAELQAGKKLELPFDARGYRFIEVSQDTADVRISLAAGTRSLGEWDGPARRAAPERVCVYTEPGTLSITISSADASTKPGARVEVHVRSLDGSRSLGDENWVRAECTQSEAALALPQAGNGLSTAQVQEQAEQQAEKYRHAAEIWAQMGNRNRAGESFLQAGWMLARQTSRYTDAVAMGLEAREQFVAIADNFGASLASMQISVPRWELVDEGLDDRGAKLGDRLAALAVIDKDLGKAVATFDAAGEPYFSAEARGHIGYNYFLLGRFREALEAFSVAKQLYESEGEAAGVTRAEANLAFVRNQATDYKRAAAAFAQTLAQYPPDAATPALADILDNSGAMHSAAGDFNNAIPQLLRAWKIHEQFADFGGMARSLNGLSVTYMRIGVPAAALDYAKQSTSMLRRRAGDAGPGGETTELISLALAGNAQRALGNPAAASASHRAALERSRNDTARLRAHLELARDALAAGNAKDARVEVESARKLIGGASEIQQLLVELESIRVAIAAGDLENARDRLTGLKGLFAAVGAPEFEIERVDTLARVEYLRGKLDDALALNGQALDQLRSLRLAVANPSLHTSLTASYRAAYELRVDLLDELRGNTTDAKRRAAMLNEIFAAADEARAGLVHETAEARVLAGDGGAETQLRTVATEIAVRENMLAAVDLGGATGVDATALRGELARLRSEYDALKPPSANYQRFGPGDYGTAGVRADTAVLVLLDSSKALRRFLATRGHVRELEALDWTPAARSQQGDKLLTGFSLLAAYPHLIVVADPLLGPLPLTALADSDGKRLIDAHDVTMSLTLRDALRIAALPDDKRRVNLSRVALFSDPIFTPYDERIQKRVTSTDAFPALARLKSSRAETDAIARLFKSANVLSYSDDLASRESALSPAVMQASVLHFATHAVASDTWPNGSGLQLTAFTKEGKPINGFVSSLDLLSQRTSTSLVVLSACDTARGDSTPGENVAGLARAFLGGGARRVVASLWAVDDAVTARLMAEFYAGLVSGKTPAVALASAQKKVAGPDVPGQRPAWAAFLLYERAP